MTESDERRDDEPGAGPEGRPEGGPAAARPVGGASRARIEVGTLDDGRTIRYFSAPAGDTR